MSIEEDPWDPIDEIPQLELDEAITRPLIEALGKAGFTVSHKFITLICNRNIEVVLNVGNLVQEYIPPQYEPTASFQSAPDPSLVAPRSLASSSLNCCWTQPNYCCNRNQPVPDKPGRYVLMKKISNNPTTWKKVGECAC
jgi:hypothetical protein